MPCSTGLGTKQADVPDTVLLHQKSFQLDHSGSLSVRELFDQLMHASIPFKSTPPAGPLPLASRLCQTLQ
jgi:hypothetical protein